MNGQEAALLLLLSGIWGSSFLFYKILGATLPPFTLVLGRIGIAAVVLNLVLALRGQALGRDAPWGQLTLLGVINCVIPFSLFAWGETQITSGMAALLNATTPLFAVLLAHLAGSERLSWGRAFGVALGMAGVGVLVGPAAFRHSAGHLLGDGACVLASLSYALASRYSRRIPNLGFVQIAAGQLLAGSLVLLPVAALTDRFWLLPSPDATTWSALAGIALLCTALAYGLFFRLVATAGPTNAVLVTFLQPISALALGWLVLGERAPSRAAAGLVLIGCGLVAIDGRLAKSLRAVRRSRAVPSPEV